MDLVKHFEKSLLLEVVLFILKCLCIEYAQLCTVLGVLGLGVHPWEMWSFHCHSGRQKNVKRGLGPVDRERSVAAQECLHGCVPS